MHSHSSRHPLQFYFQFSLRSVFSLNSCIMILSQPLLEIPQYTVGWHLFSPQSYHTGNSQPTCKQAKNSSSSLVLSKLAIPFLCTNIHGHLLFPVWIMTFSVLMMSPAPWHQQKLSVLSHVLYITETVRWDPSHLHMHLPYCSFPEEVCPGNH